MSQTIAVYHGKKLLILGLVVLGGFCTGLHLQKGWTKLEPVPLREMRDVVEEGIPVARVREQVQAEQGGLQSLRLHRDREQSRQRERLQAMIRGNDPGSELAKQTTAELLELERRITKELELENLLAVRGYPENMVTIGGTAVTVIIAGQRLTSEKVAAIGQWAVDVSGRPIGQIRIVDQSVK